MTIHRHHRSHRLGRDDGCWLIVTVIVTAGQVIVTVTVVVGRIVTIRCRRLQAGNDGDGRNGRLRVCSGRCVVGSPDSQCPLQATFATSMVMPTPRRFGASRVNSPDNLFGCFGQPFGGFVSPWVASSAANNSDAVPTHFWWSCIKRTKDLDVSQYATDK